MSTTTALRPSFPNPAALGTFIFLAPLPALQAQCPDCAGRVKFTQLWQCTVCEWKDTPASLLGPAPRGWGEGTGEGVE